MSSWTAAAVIVVLVSVSSPHGVEAGSAIGFAFGGSTFDLDELDAALAAEGFSSLESSDYSAGLGGYKLTDSGLVIGVEIQGAGQTVYNDSSEASVSVSSFMLQVGRVVYRRGDLKVFPLVGLGRCGVGVRMVKRAPTPTFGEVLAHPFRESRMDAGGLALQFAIGADHHLRFSQDRRRRAGLLIGVRVGYTYKPGEATWQMEDGDVLGGPSADTSGPFFRVHVGVGWFSR